MLGLCLDGAVALVTGAASGIGRASAVALGQAGARLALVDRDEAGLADTVSALQNMGAEARSYPFDLSNLPAIAELVVSALADFGRIDILVNAAGIVSKDTILTVDLETWQRVHAINLCAPMLLVQHVGRHMIDRGGGGRIVNVSSSSAYQADLMCFPAYSTSKAGLDALTRSAAAALGPHDINVNSVVPGVTLTPMVGNIDPSFAVSGPLANLMQRLSVAEDVAGLVAFLCSPLARQITAQAIHTSAGNVV